MASVRILKKSINTIIDEVLIDCLLAINFHPKKEKQIRALIEETLELHQNLLVRVNQRPKGESERKVVRQHYQQVEKDMFVSIDEILTKLGAVNK